MVKMKDKIILLKISNISTTSQIHSGQLIDPSKQESFTEAIKNQLKCGEPKKSVKLEAVCPM